MNKFRMTKSLAAILLGVAVTGLSTSAFAASSCPTSTDNNWVSFGTVPYVQFLPQYGQAAVQIEQTVPQYRMQEQYAAPQYQVPAAAYQPSYAPAVYQQAPAESQPANQATVEQPVNHSVPAKQDQVQDQNSDQVNKEILNLVNQERAKAGLKPVTLDSQLSKVAMDKAKDMANNHYFDHISPTLGSPFDMMTRAGIQSNTAGENIAMGQHSAQEVMTQWMNSQGHRENILNPNFTKIGVASYNGYWVQEFIG